MLASGILPPRWAMDISGGRRLRVVVFTASSGGGAGYAPACRGHERAARKVGRGGFIAIASKMAATFPVGLSQRRMASAKATRLFMVSGQPDHEISCTPNISSMVRCRYGRQDWPALR